MSTQQAGHKVISYVQPYICKAVNKQWLVYVCCLGLAVNVMQATVR